MLHTVNKSPFERSSLASCLRLAKKGSTILLIEDGVYAALQGTSASNRVAEKCSEFSFHALGPDLEARGLAGKPLIEGVTLVDYGGFVDLVEKHDAVHSWL